MSTNYSSRITQEEIETIVNYNRIDEFAEVYTSDYRVMNKLNKLVKKYPESYSIISQDDISKTYKFPKKLVQFRAPSSAVAPVLTEEQKAARTKRLMDYNAKRAAEKAATSSD